MRTGKPTWAVLFWIPIKEEASLRLTAVCNYALWKHDSSMDLKAHSQSLLFFITLQWNHYSLQTNEKTETERLRGAFIIMNHSTCSVATTPNLSSELMNHFKMKECFELCFKWILASFLIVDSGWKQGRFNSSWDEIYGNAF